MGDGVNGFSGPGAGLQSAGAGAAQDLGLHASALLAVPWSRSLTAGGFRVGSRVRRSCDTRRCRTTRPVRLMR